MTDAGGTSVADWITAIGTAGGFLAAGGGFVYDRYRRRQRDLHAQAELVDGWLGREETFDADGDKPARMKLVGYISNASRAAVRDVRFEIRPNPHSENPVFGVLRADVGTVPPTRGNNPFVWQDELIAGVGYSRDVDFRRSSLRGYILWIRFTDTGGRRWVRHPDGRLEETASVDDERASELAQMESQHPGYLKAIAESLTPEKALDKLREFNRRHATETRKSRRDPPDSESA